MQITSFIHGNFQAVCGFDCLFCIMEVHNGNSTGLAVFTMV